MTFGLARSILVKRIIPLLVGLSSLIGASASAGEPPKIALRDGDRIVLIGDTFIEREQKYGYLETLLTLQNPDKALEFRNLGWSGDTVYGHARAGFGTPVDGFRLLKEHVLALKPTVLIVGYGMGESFDGEAGLSRFEEGLNALLDTLAPTHAKVILLSPITHEDMGRPLPDPAPHNKALQLYSKAIESIAQKRKAAFISLQMGPEMRSAKGIRRPLTDNGIHPTDFGYAVLAKIVAGQFQSATTSAPWSVDLVVGGSTKVDASSNPKVSGQVSSRDGFRFETTDAQLPEPRTVAALAASEGAGASASGRSLKVKGLAAGRFALKVDGRVVAVAEADDWAKGKALPTTTPEFAQVEALRATINEKNLLYFHRWRPQNETYLFGFRKHEQGNNAREIPLFDPLVAEKEQVIARLRVPKSHVYELVRESEVGK